MIDVLYFAEAARVLWPFAKCSTFIYAIGPADCGNVSLTRHKRKSGYVFCHIEVSALIGTFSAEALSRHLMKLRIKGMYEREQGFEFGFKRSEEHTSELQSLMRISYDVFCL